MAPAPKVAVVTDSTALLPPDHDLPGAFVVPLQVVIDQECFDEGRPEVSAEAVVAALATKHKVTTSRPSPTTLRDLYARLAAEGYDEILSVHLSGDMSGTLESAQLAAAEAAVPVVVLDTRAVGPCVGFAVAAAVQAIADGASAEDAAKAALARADATRSLFYVDSLEPMRRGGRIGAAAHLVGAALAVKPLLMIEEGRIVLGEKVRTSQRAIARLEALALEAAGERRVEVAVAHLAAPERAERLVASLTEHLGDRLAVPVRCGEIGAALGVHVGAGMLAVVVAPAL
jgi:DegV family protein with EDD domain